MQEKLEKEATHTKSYSAHVHINKNEPLVTAKQNDPKKTGKTKPLPGIERSHLLKEARNSSGRVLAKTFYL